MLLMKKFQPKSLAIKLPLMSLILNKVEGRIFSSKINEADTKKCFRRQ